MKDRIRLEILRASQSEHLKYEKEMAHIWDFDNPKRKMLLSESNKLADEINELQKKVTSQSK